MKKISKAEDGPVDVVDIPLVVEVNSSSWCPSMSKWPHMKTVAMVQSERTLNTGKITQDCRFYISSMKAMAERLLQITRQHWAIENSLHWTLDMTCREGAPLIRKDLAPENFAIMPHNYAEFASKRPNY